MKRNPGSFRDPSGHVYENDGNILRSMALSYRAHWEWAVKTRLLAQAVDEGLLMPFAEMPDMECGKLVSAGIFPAGTWKALRVARLPFVSYPYEWCFSQLRDAALLTLDLHIKALEHDCVLKDASAFNVQFFRGRPVFIDHLSFERWNEGEPWQGYRQFCEHFLAPMALASSRDLRCSLLPQIWPAGIPLDLVCKLLPRRTLLSPGIAVHLHAHSAMQKHHSDGHAANAIRSVRLSKRKMLDVAFSLRSAVAAIKPPRQRTEWGDYYSDTNYSAVAMKAKLAAVREAVAANGALALDIGSNTGVFSHAAAAHFSTVLSTDMDHMAVERQYCAQCPQSVLPLVVDIAAPPPALGWMNAERPSFIERCRGRVDMLLLLAVCHHLVFTSGIPFSGIAEFCAAVLSPGGKVLVEFVPKEDSQAQRLLASRDDIFHDYNLENFLSAFCGAGLIHVGCRNISDSCRALHLFTSL